MPTKINRRDAELNGKTQARASGKAPTRKADISQIGEPKRSKRTTPPSPPSRMARAIDVFEEPRPTQPDQRSGMSLDGDERERHRTRMDWLMGEAHRQAPNRRRMARCEAFYDSEQWRYEDAQQVRDERGQEPIVYNEIKPSIDWLIGTERRVRTDFVVMPELSPEDENADEADEDAQVKTKLLKYLDDTNMAHFERSWAAEDAFKAGIGWIEVGLRGDRTGVPVYQGAVSWRCILWDSHCEKRDLSDARYIFRVKVVDADVALAIFPNKRAEIERCIQTGDAMHMLSEWMGGMGALLSGLDAFNTPEDTLDDVTTRPIDMFNARKRVLLIECWSRDPVPRKPEQVGLGDPIEFRINVAIMTEFDTLVEGPSPYKHDRFPFIPVWAYRKRSTGLPYSPIWPLIGPQMGLNFRMTRSVFEATANQWEMEVGAIDEASMDLEELRDEYNDPQGIAVYAPGALSGGKVRRVEHGAKSQEQLLLADRDIMHLRSMSGVTGENRGERTNATSGKAVLAKQDQGSLLTAELFDNLLFARKMEGDMTLSEAEQGMLAPRAFRVPGSPPGDIQRINVPQEDGTYLNDISKRRAKFVVGEQAWKQAYAEAAFESLLQVLTQLSGAAPMAVVNLLDLVFDMHPNLPRKRALIERMRQINGQQDPDGKLTPEQEAEKAKKAAMEKAKFDAMMAKLIADVQVAQAQGAKLRSDAVMARLKTIYEAAQGAAVVASMPEVAPIADDMLKSAGFEDQTPDDGLIDSPPPAAATPTPQPGVDPVAPEPGASNEPALTA